MHEDKRELLRNAIEKLDVLTDRIRDLDDVFYEFCHVQVGIFNELLITSKTNRCKWGTFLDELHKLKESLGNYKIDNYWIPYADTVCVAYWFKGRRVRFTINACEEYTVEKIIAELSGGKCKITTKTSFDVECSI